MDREDLGLKLKQFYLLEAYQVKFFDGQIPSLDNEHTVKAYEHMVEVERQHVDYFAEKLGEYGFDLPDPADDAFASAGFVSAKALDLFSLAEKFKVGIAVETKASEKYGEFIKMAGDEKALTKRLWHNRIDEEFHKYWFAANLEALTGIENRIAPVSETSWR